MLLGLLSTFLLLDGHEGPLPKNPEKKTWRQHCCQCQTGARKIPPGKSVAFTQNGQDITCTLVKLSEADADNMRTTETISRCGRARVWHRKAAPRTVILSHVVVDADAGGGNECAVTF
jgi:hypothetical protein